MTPFPLFPIVKKRPVVSNLPHTPSALPLPSSLSLYSSFLSLYSLSHSSSSVLPLYVSHIVSFTLSLSLGSPPLFRFPFRRRLYRHLGLSDRRLTYPPPRSCSLLSLSPLDLLLALYSLATPSIRSSWATIVYYLSGKLITDSRTPTTSRTPLDLRCLGLLPTAP